VAGRLQLGANAAAGNYTLEVTVVDGEDGGVGCVGGGG
jgi:hypothetical protein